MKSCFVVSKLQSTMICNPYPVVRDSEEGEKLVKKVGDHAAMRALRWW